MVATGIEGVGFLVARVLFGGVLAFMGANHFLGTDEMAGYAEYKGVPAPKLSVLASGAVLILSGLGIAAGIFPLVSGLAVAAFLVVSALLMHDFWAVDDEQAQTEMTQFLKNVALAGGAIAFAAIAAQEWAYSVGLSL